MSKELVIECNKEMQADPGAWWRVASRQGDDIEERVGRVIGRTEVKLYMGPCTYVDVTVFFRDAAETRTKRTRRELRVDMAPGRPARAVFEDPIPVETTEVYNKAFFEAMEDGVDTPEARAIARASTKFIRQRLASPGIMETVRQVGMYETQGKMFVDDALEDLEEKIGTIPLSEPTKEALKKKAVTLAAQKLVDRCVSDAVEEELEKLVVGELRERGADPDALWDTRGVRRLKK